MHVWVRDYEIDQARCVLKKKRQCKAPFPAAMQPGPTGRA